MNYRISYYRKNYEIYWIVKDKIQNFKYKNKYKYTVDSQYVIKNNTNIWNDNSLKYRGISSVVYISNIKYSLP